MNHVVEGLKQLSVRTLHIVCADETHGVARSVYCARRGGAASLDECAGCAECSAMPRSLGARDAKVVCGASVGRERPRDPSLDMREAMLRTTVGELLAGVTTCVHPETDVDVATELLSRPDAKCAPVVDCDGKLVGILSARDLVRENFFERGCEASVPSTLGRGFHVEQPSQGTVADLMTPVAQALPEDAPLSFAVGLMAATGLRQIPVVGREGRVVGMFTAIDALRWTATAIGYVL